MNTAQPAVNAFQAIEQILHARMMCVQFNLNNKIEQMHDALSKMRSMIGRLFLSRKNKPQKTALKKGRETGSKSNHTDCQRMS